MKSFGSQNVKRLLIRGTNWVGDAVMSLPALTLVRSLLPEAKISLLALPWVSGIYEECESIDELILYERSSRHQGIPGRLRLIAQLRSRFDAALLFQNAFEAAFLARLAGIPIRAGYSCDGRGWLLTHPVQIDRRTQKLHQAYYYLDLVDQLFQRLRPALNEPSEPLQVPGCPPPVPDISIPVGHVRQQSARHRLRELGVNFQKRLIGVNPGASFGAAKRWPGERYAELLDRLIQEHRVDVVIFGSSKEKAIAESIQSLMRHQVLILSGSTCLAELTAMISICDLFITNDSGPMHLAAALRVPTIAIFGPTDEMATGPLSPLAVVLKKRVECSPCLLRECPIDHRCMTRLTAEEVYQQAVQMLSSKPAGGTN